MFWALASTLVLGAPLTSVTELDPDFLVELVDEHPSLAIRDAEVRQGAADVMRERLTPTSNLSVGVGLSDPFQAEGPVVESGVWVGVNLVEIATWPSRIASAAATRDRYARTRDAEKYELQLELRNLWAETSHWEHMLSLRERNLATMNANHLVAQEQFERGELTVSDLARLSQWEATAAGAVITARKELSTRLVQLEGLIGMSLQDAHDRQQQEQNR